MGRLCGREGSTLQLHKRKVTFVRKKFLKNLELRKIIYIFVVKRNLFFFEMKRVLSFAILMFATVVMTAQHRADRQQLTHRGSSTMILLGDPQAYVKYDLNQPLLELQMSRFSPMP